MKYLFFDTECANCFSGIGKICEFGYALFDEDYNLIEKNDIFINPESKFHLRGRKDQNSIHLSKDEKFYFKQPNFPHFYDQIKALLTQKDVQIYAFSSNNDLGFLLTTIKRYKQQMFDFVCYDAQVVTINYLKDDVKFPGLESSYEQIVGVPSDLVAHEASNDAFNTGILCFAIAKAVGVKLCDYVKNMPGVTSSLLQENQKRVERERLRVLKEAVTINDPEKLEHKKYNNKRYFITKSIRADNEIILKVLSKFKEQGFINTTSIKNCDRIIVETSDDKEKYKKISKKLGRKTKIIYLKKFLDK